MKSNSIIENTFRVRSPVFSDISSSWLSDCNPSQSDLKLMQDKEDKRLSPLTQKQKINYVLNDLKIKVEATNLAHETYLEISSKLKKEDFKRLGEYEHGQRKISSKEGNDFGVIKDSLYNYQMSKLTTLYSFSTLTKLCVEQDICKDKILEHNQTIENFFPQKNRDYDTFQDCYLNSTWSSLVISSKYRLKKILYLTANILETSVGDNETQLMRLKHALPFNILINQKIYLEDLEEVFAEAEESKKLTKIFIDSLDHAFKISKEKYTNFVENNKLEEFLLKYGLDTNNKPTFKDIVTFLSSNKILSSFENRNLGASKSLKQIFEKVKKLIANTDYFSEDPLYYIATLPDDIFSKELNNQKSKTSKALYMWSKFFLCPDKEASFVKATPNELKVPSSLKKNFNLSAKNNILVYDEGNNSDDEWTIVDKISEHMPKGRYKSENLLNQNMYDEYQGIIKFLNDKDNKIDINLIKKQHEQSFNQPSFESEFNKTFNEELLQEPSVSFSFFGNNLKHDKYSDEPEQKELMGISNILDDVNIDQ